MSVHPRTRGSLVRRLAGAVVACLLILTGTAGCGGLSASEDGPPTVVTSVYPLTWLARQVAGDDARVQNLGGSQADPHHLELTPRQLIDVERAEMSLYIKGMQPAMDEAVAQHGGKHDLDVASVVDILPAAHQGHEAETRGAPDPHMWLDPVRFASIARELGDRLAMVDKAHADAYERRAREVVHDLRELHRAYSSGLEGCDSRTIITSHSAFAYTAQRYGLHQVGIAGLDPEVEPSPGRLAQVTRIASDRDVDVIFHDQTGSAELASVIADEIGARTAPLDTVTHPPADGSGGYIAAMRGNLDKLRTALGCS